MKNKFEMPQIPSLKTLAATILLASSALTSTAGGEKLTNTKAGVEMSTEKQEAVFLKNFKENNKPLSGYKWGEEDVQLVDDLNNKNELPVRIEATMYPKDKKSGLDSKGFVYIIQKDGKVLGQYEISQGETAEMKMTEVFPDSSFGLVHWKQVENTRTYDLMKIGPDGTFIKVKNISKEEMEKMEKENEKNKEVAQK